MSVPVGTLKRICILMAAVLALSILSFYVAPLFDLWESVFLDWHLKSSEVQGNGEKIVLILGGDRSMIALDNWPWPREVHAAMISERLGGASVVAYDIFLVDRSSQDQDLALSQAIARHGNVVLGNVYREDGASLQPLEIFRAHARTGHFNYYPDTDNVMRRYPLAKKGKTAGFVSLTPSFVLTVLEAAGYSPVIDAAGRRLILAGGETRRLDDRLGVFKLSVGKQAYPVYEFSDVLEGKIPPEAFEDAVVFVGISAAGASDNIHTAGGYQPGTQVLADVFYSILSGDSPHPPSAALQIAYCSLLFALCLLGAAFLPGRVHWLPMLLSAAGAVLLPHGLFQPAGVYLPTAALCAMLLACGALQLFYIRVIRERQQRQEMLMRLITCMIAAVDAKDPVTAGHSQRVSDIAAQIAGKAGMRHRDVEAIRFAGIIHDIGKIGVSDTVLHKPGRFTPEEFEAMKQHPDKGVAIMASAGLPEPVIQGIQDHHERLDGKGYPAGKAAGSLGVFAQIIKIADVYDALVSKRQYKEPWPMEKVCDMLYEGRGSEFNAGLVDLFLEDIRPPHWCPKATENNEVD